MTLSPRRNGVWLLAGLVLTAVVGCGSKEPISSYTIPRATERDRPGVGTYRILGAIYPEDKPQWYFKFMGTAEVVGKYEVDFDLLTKSVSIGADPSLMPDFKLPAGWTRTGPRTRAGFTTDEVLKFGPPDDPQEVTITHVAGGLEANLRRWAEQVGAEFDRLNLGGMAKLFDATKCRGLRVDLRGPKNPASRGGPMMKPR